MRISTAHMEAKRRSCHYDAKGVRQRVQNPGSGLVLDPAIDLRPGRIGEEI